MQIRQPILYGSILFLAFVVVFVALGGGLFNQSTPWPGQWQHQSFYSLCHQIADRSFWINGQPMAVCSRCIGIYSGFALGWGLLPIVTLLNIKRVTYIKKIVVFMLLFNLLDAAGNFFGLWQNTLVSRTLLGGMLGSSAALIFIGDFFHHN
ncbi:DUF2085 domain-containing protein [Fodinibius sp.]|uniref:DUF2085 domain-containing protein n=1 Tax=Fodinibius sp. TaxID=1872440 RepID=UPI002ACDE8F3|nr:DUF2085 domain-containing protein [Fodinibius sp.]MDZ7658558.1 DUF2085 domain-containing protein [Fodinibius sp.]